LTTQARVRVVQRKVLGGELEPAVSGAQAADRPSDVFRFRLPEHFRKRWWERCAPELMARGTSSPEFDSFAQAFVEYAHFKQIPLSTSSRFDVLVRAPDQPAGSTGSESAALVNLGDAPTRILVGHERICLDPGDGYWVPAHRGPLLPGETSGMSEVDVLLQIH
jgi:hypothetical protein